MRFMQSKHRWVWVCAAAGCLILPVLGVYIFRAVGPFFQGGLVRIEPQEIGLIVSEKEPGGYADRALLPGLHLVFPNTKIYRLNTGRMVYHTAIMNCNCGSPRSAAFITRDGQAVVVQYHVAFQIDPAGAVELQRKWNKDFIYGVVAPISQQVIEETGRLYTAGEVIAEKQAELEQAVFDRLEAELAKEHLILLEVKFDDARLGEE